MKQKKKSKRNFTTIEKDSNSESSLKNTTFNTQKQKLMENSNPKIITKKEKNSNFIQISEHRKQCNTKNHLISNSKKADGKGMVCNQYKGSTLVELKIASSNQPYEKSNKIKAPLNPDIQPPSKSLIEKDTENKQNYNKRNVFSGFELNDGRIIANDNSKIVTTLDDRNNLKTIQSRNDDPEKSIESSKKIEKTLVIQGLDDSSQNQHKNVNREIETSNMATPCFQHINESQVLENKHDEAITIHEEKCLKEDEKLESAILNDEVGVLLKVKLDDTPIDLNIISESEKIGVLVKKNRCFLVNGNYDLEYESRFKKEMCNIPEEEEESE